MDDALRQELSRLRDKESRSMAPEQAPLRDKLVNDLAHLSGASSGFVQIPSGVAPHIVVTAIVYDIDLSDGDIAEATKLLRNYRRS